MEKKLFEFSAVISANIVVAAETEQQALDAISGWSASTWTDHADIDDVSDIELFDVRIPSHQAKGYLENLAHVIVSKHGIEIV